MYKNNTRDIQSEVIANDFFHRWKNELFNAYQVERKFSKRLTKRGNVDKYLAFNEEIFKKISIDYKVSGSKRNPVINFTYLNPKILVDKELFGDENCLALETCCLPVKQRNDWPSIYEFTDIFSCPISKHTISRVLFRLGLKKRVEEGDYEILFDQFKFLPLVTQFYLFIFKCMQAFKIIDQADLENTSLIFPSAGGLFIGELKHNVQGGQKTKNNSLCIKTFIDDDIFKGDEQGKVKNELIKIFSQSSQSIENPFSLVKPFVPNTDILKNIFAHGIFYFSKLMEIQDDFLYLLSRENSHFNDTKFFRLSKAFKELNRVFREIKTESGLSDDFSIDEIYENLNPNFLEFYK